MTGPEHYRRAEALLAYQQQSAFTDVDEQGRVVECYPIVDEDDTSRNALLAAQIHATLALAAATAEPIAQKYCGDEAGTMSREWSKAIS